METRNQTPYERSVVDLAVFSEARAIQRDAGTPSAVEYLKAREVEGKVIEQVLGDESFDATMPASDRT